MTQTDAPALAPELSANTASGARSELGRRPSGGAATRPGLDDRGLLPARAGGGSAEDRPRTSSASSTATGGSGERRRPGEVKIRVFNPAPSAGEGAVGWTDTKTVIDIVTDDMPSLVDSVIGALTIRDVTVHRVLHPILIACRDAERCPAGRSPGNRAGPPRRRSPSASRGCTS